MIKFIFPKRFRDLVFNIIIVIVLELVLEKVIPHFVVPFVGSISFIMFSVAILLVLFMPFSYIYSLVKK